MPDIKKFLDGEGLKFLWQKISLGDYPNNDTLVTVINAIDENKQDKITGTEKQVAGFDINGKLIAKDLDETLSQAGVPADAAATGAAIKRASAQSNYTENDNTSPAHIQNRPFHDAWESAVCAGVMPKTDTMDGGFMHDEGEAGALRRAFENGRAYTLLVNETAYTGFASFMEHPAFPGVPMVVLVNPEITSDMLIGIFDFIGAGQSETNLAIIGQDIVDMFEAKDYPFIIYEGNVPPDTVNAESPIGNYLGGVFIRVSENRFSESDIANGCELRMILQDDTETIFTKDDITIANDTPVPGVTMFLPPNDEGYYGVCTVQAGGVNIEGVGSFPEGTYFMADTSVQSVYKSVASFRIPYSLIFSKRIPLKKLDKKFLPDDIIKQSDWKQNDETAIDFIKNKPNKDDALAILVEMGFIDPATAEDGSIFTDDDGSIYTL